MKLIIFSKDTKIFDKSSSVQKRMLDLAGAFEQVHIIVLSSGRQKYLPELLPPNLFLYSGQASFYFFGYATALSIGLQIVKKIGKTGVVITAQDPFEVGCIAYLVSKISRVKLQLQVHTDLGNFYFRKDLFKNRIRLLIAGYLLPRADKVRVVSSKIKDFLISSFGVEEKNITILPVWMDFGEYRSAPVKIDLRKLYPQFDEIILISSRLTREKNISLALLSFKKISEQRPMAGLIIVGDGPERLNLENQVKALGLEGRVVFRGWSDDLTSCYKTADLFVNTSWYEGFGRTLLEALVCGCPVVSTDVGIAKEAGVTIADFTPDDFAGKMIAVLSKPGPVLFPAKFNLTKEEYIKIFKTSLE
ncbi:MAG: glycosyltransferase [Candidatus Vogelbacteria bacterium]|nr:glycosyltransferase [Candidatus Vogelbacteria bacterium]